MTQDFVCTRTHFSRYHLLTCRIVVQEMLGCTLLVIAKKFRVSVACLAVLISLSAQSMPAAQSVLLRLPKALQQVAVLYLPDHDLGSCFQLNHAFRASLTQHWELRNRASARAVLVRTRTTRVWLDPSQDGGWDQAEEILDARPRCLVPDASGSCSLLKRLPLRCWSVSEANTTNVGALRSVSRILAVMIPAAFRRYVVRPLNCQGQLVHIAQSVLLMDAYLHHCCLISELAAMSAVRDNVSIEARPQMLAQMTRHFSQQAQMQVFTVMTLMIEAFCTSSLTYRHTAHTLMQKGGPIQNAIHRYELVRDSAWCAARNDAQQAIHGLICRNQSFPSPDELIRAVYQVVELTSSLAHLERCTQLIQKVMGSYPLRLVDLVDLSHFKSTTTWEAFKAAHLREVYQNEDQRFFLDPWLSYIDREVAHLEMMTHLAAESSVALHPPHPVVHSIGNLESLLSANPTSSSRWRGAYRRVCELICCGSVD